MKILVTGGLGAVGSPLAAELRARGNEVWVLDRAHHHGVGGRYYVRCDVGEYRQLAEVLRRERFDLVYHAAAEFGRLNGEDFYETLWRTNAVGTKHVIRLQEELGFRLVHFSSSEVYGDWRDVMGEDVPGRHAIQQLNDYAITKWVNELQIRNSAATKRTESVIVRLFNTYGPGEHYSDYRSVICLFTYRALHRLPYRVYLNHHRTSSYIDDTVRTLATIAERFRAGEVYNIAGECYHDIKGISDMIVAAVGTDDRLVEYVPVEEHNTLDKKADARKAKEHLGHRETVSIEEGIRRTVAWQRTVYDV